MVQRRREQVGESVGCIGELGTDDKGEKRRQQTADAETDDCRRSAGEEADDEHSQEKERAID